MADRILVHGGHTRKLSSLCCETIADLAGAETIGIPHVAEALQYRHTGWG